MTEVVKFESKIVGYSLLEDEAPSGAAPEPVVAPEKPKRPKKVVGATYKLRLPEASMYVTINDLDGKPFEIFVNSKDTEHFQWVTALTRMMSAVFRRETDVAFLVDELKAVVDPNGGFWQEGRFIPSIVHQLGAVLEEHLGDEVEPAAPVEVPAEMPAYEQPKGLKCGNCGEYAVGKVDGCLTCRSCGESKCG